MLARGTRWPGQAGALPLVLSAVLSLPLQEAAHGLCGCVDAEWQSKDPVQGLGER